MEGQFQVPASLCSNPFPCSCSYRETSSSWASGKIILYSAHVLPRFLSMMVGPDRDSVVIAEVLLLSSVPVDMGLTIPPYSRRPLYGLGWDSGMETIRAR